jgi:hypothetical protein
MAGARDKRIMAHTRPVDLKTMRGYVQRAKLVIEPGQAAGAVSRAGGGAPAA